MPPRSTPRESTRAVVAWLNSLPQCHAEKRHGEVMGIKGNADVTGCIAGRHFELEAKRPGREATPLQAARLRLWARAGAITGVFHSRADVIAIFAEHGVIVQ